MHGNAEELLRDGIDLRIRDHTNAALESLVVPVDEPLDALDPSYIWRRSYKFDDC